MFNGSETQINVKFNYVYGTARFNVNVHLSQMPILWVLDI